MIDPQLWKAKGSTFDYHGHGIFYIREGVGDTLLLIHGFPTCSWDWNKMWSSLTSKHNVITLDMIGFGYSAKPRNYSYSLMDQADLIERLLDHLNIKDAHILAHDYGDTVAQELLHRQNHKDLSFEINSCVLLNGGLFHGVHRPRLIQKLLLTPLGSIIQRLYTKEKFATTFKNIFGKNTPPTSEEIDVFWELLNYNEGMLIFNKLIRYLTERKTHRERWLKALQESKAPLRLIDGVTDPISGQHLVDHYIKVIPNPDVIRLEGVGHYPQTEAPELVLEHYLNFRQKIELS